MKSESLYSKYGVLPNFSEFLEYDKTTGNLYWKVRSSLGVRIGFVAGCKDSKGYVNIGFAGKIYKAHRIVWYMETSEWPKGCIDHINGNPSDNRMCNLRDVSTRENGNNQKSHRQGKIPGISSKKLNGRYRVKIQIAGKDVHLAWMENKEYAGIAYSVAKENLDFYNGCNISFRTLVRSKVDEHLNAVKGIPPENKRYDKRSNTQKGEFGVSYCSKKNIWVSRIRINGKQVFLGYFDSKEKAINSSGTAREIKKEYTGDNSLFRSKVKQAL